MENTGNSRLSVLIKPHLDANEAVSHLTLTLTLGGLNGGLLGGNQGGSPRGSPPTQDDRNQMTIKTSHTNEAENIRSLLNTAEVRDSQGTLTLQLQNEGWKASRKTEGDVRIQYDATPLSHDISPESNKLLRVDQGGIVGAGASFIPRLVVDTPCDITVAWDISQVPVGTRGVCSLGEGSVTASGNIDMLMDSVFMVGKINSFPPDTPGVSDAGFCGTYWLGDLPENLNSLQDFSSNMFPRVSAHFKDEEGSYRAFLRKIPKGQRGLSLMSSSLIDYDDDTKEEDDWELVRLLNSSMIATWTRIDPEEDGTENEWFVKGLSHLYSIYLPFRFGQRTPDYFRATLNGYLSAYYTNPLVSLPLNEIVALKHSSWHADSTVAMRSCIYMIRMDAHCRRASVKRELGVERPIDEMLRDICVRRRKGEKIQTKDWLRYLGEWLGEDDAAEQFANMKAGQVMDLEDMKSGFGGSLVLEEQHVLEMGFEKESLDAGVAKGVVEGSRAAQAGLRDGDVIVWTSRPESCETNYDSKFRLKVLRDGKEVDVEYWPRGESKVKVWQSRKKPA